MKGLFMRFVSLLLCLSFLVSLAACSKSDSSGTKSNNDAVSTDESSGEEVKETVKDGKLKTGYSIDSGAPVLKGDVVLLQLNETATFAMEYGAMPFLSAFADSGVYYSAFYAQRGNADGMYSALTSLYSSLDGTDPEASYYSLAHLFGDNGYNTSAVIMSDTEYPSEKLGLDTVTRADTLGDLLSSILEVTENSRDDFMFAEFANMAYPYIPDSENNAELSGNKLLNSYLESAAYGDSVLKSLFDSIDELGDNAPTVIIYGTAPVLDKDFDLYAKDYPDLFNNGFSYGEAYGTPFIISSPVLESYKGTALTTVYDIYPTVAALFDFSSDKMLISGDNVYMNSSLPEAEAPIASPVNLAAGKSYTFGPFDGSDAAYMFPSLGDNGTMLTNGVITDGKNIPESGCGFVLKQCSKTHYITVDLGESKSFDRVVLAGVAYNDNTYTGLNGNSFTVEVSEDGETFVNADGECFFRTEEGSVFRTYNFILSKAKKGRYVRVGISASSTYLTASEVLIYGTVGDEMSNSESFRFFAVQGEDCTRGNFITDSMYYEGISDVDCAFSSATGEEISARPYKNRYNYVMATINECEYAVEFGYFEGGKTYAEMHASLPKYSNLTLSVDNSVDGGGSMVGHKGFLSNCSYTYTPSALDGVWNGLKYDTNRLILADGETEGTLITKEFDLGSFEKLYAVAGAKINGGKVEIYASYVMDNGVNTRWEKLNAYGDNGYDGGVNCLAVASASGENGESKRFRLMIKLTKGEGEAGPEVYTLTVSPIPAEKNNGEAGEIGEAVEVLLDISAHEGYNSGVLAVETLVAKALSTDPDFDCADSYIKGSVGEDAYTGITTFAHYACSMDVYAFVDAYGVTEFIDALDCGQPIIFNNNGTYVIAVGYSEDGITVIDPANGMKETVGFDKINSMEVLIVDSSLFTPNIIDNFIAENSAVRPGIVVDKKKYIVIHNTGNYGVSATASAHDKYIQGLENDPDRKVSWHYTVDDVEIYHHLPDNESAWHASDGSEGDGNKYGIGIEICVNGFPGVYEGEEYEAWLEQFMKALKNASYLVAKLMIENDIPMDCIKQHYDFAPNKKNCPMQMRYNSGSGTFTRDEGDMWVYFMDQVEKQYARLTAEAK